MRATLPSALPTWAKSDYRRTGHPQAGTEQGVQAVAQGTGHHPVSCRSDPAAGKPLAAVGNLAQSLHSPRRTGAPNPTELVERDALKKAIDTLRERFDYVILDTAPIGMVTDTQIIARQADMSIYVCRADYTQKADFEVVNALRAEKKLPNMCILLNDIDMDKRQNGYYYGYGKYGKYGKYGYGKKYGYGYGYGYGK